MDPGVTLWRLGSTMQYISKCKDIEGPVGRPPTLVRRRLKKKRKKKGGGRVMAA